MTTCPVCCPQPQPQSRSDDTACPECTAEILEYRTVLAERGVEMMPIETQAFVIDAHILEEAGFSRNDAIVMMLDHRKKDTEL